MTTAQNRQRTAFAPDVLAADLGILRSILAGFLAARRPEDWSRRTEARLSGWTLHQTLAHVLAIAELFDQSLVEALQGRTLAIPGLEHRRDLAAFNQRKIADYTALPAPDLAARFLATLDHTAQQTDALTPDQLEQRVSLAAYNRSLTLAHLIGNQLVHPGIVHAAQLANGAGLPPLWEQYDPALMSRQLSRFFQVLSYAYWPERGGALQATVNYRVAGAGGGCWHVAMRPDGGASGEGAAAHPALRMWFRSAHALCRVSTLQVPLARAALTGQLVCWGNLRLGLQIPRLFMPT